MAGYMLAMAGILLVGLCIKFRCDGWRLAIAVG
jgi:hypothetical protein